MSSEVYTRFPGIEIMQRTHDVDNRGSPRPKRGKEELYSAAARRLEDHRRIWQTKEVLRNLYDEWYAKILTFLVPGKTVELGSGPGNLGGYQKDVVTTDLVWCPWLHAVCDAMDLPFRTASLSNLVLFDVLHHIESPKLFFDEAARTLRPGGRVVISDPYISLFSRLVFALFHEELVDLKADPLDPGKEPQPRELKNPFDSNQAVATILFWKRLESTMTRIPSFTVLERSRDSFLRYPLSGGFGRSALLPGWAFPFFSILERILVPLAKWLSFRTLVVLHRT